MTEEIQPFTLKIKRDTWEQFKNTVPRSTTLNATIIQLIEKHIEQHETLQRIKEKLPRENEN